MTEIADKIKELKAQIELLEHMTSITDKIKELEAQLAVLKSLQQQDRLVPNKDEFPDPVFPDPLLPLPYAPGPWKGYPHHYGCMCNRCQPYVIFTSYLPYTNSILI